jgi:O-antigen ligase
MLAGWIALLIIFTRLNRLYSWIIDPLGLMLLYAVTGLISAALFLTDPAEGLYFGANYLAIVLVLLAIVLVADPLPDLRKVLMLTWIIGTIFTLSMLGAIPFLGRAGISEVSGPVGVRAYGGAHGEIMGMASTRNTGFARYAAISALVALPGLLRKGKLSVRATWGTIFAASMYALVLANGRTETMAFVAALVLVLVAEKTKRTANILIGIGAAIILGVRGFYSAFFLYITRTGHIDTTMSGRTATWEEGWRILWNSPWAGLGFQADRYFLGTHMHNAYLHVLFQSGFIGGGAILIALLITWYYVIKYFYFRQPADKTLIPPEIPAVLMFVTISSLTESTFAYFSAAWLLSAPIVPYVMALRRHQQRTAHQAALERDLRLRLARRRAREEQSQPEVSPEPASGGVAG